MDCSPPGFPFFYWSSLKITSSESRPTPSNRLILCHRLLDPNKPVWRHHESQMAPEVRWGGGRSSPLWSFGRGGSTHPVLPESRLKAEVLLSLLESGHCGKYVVDMFICWWEVLIMPQIAKSYLVTSSQREKIKLQVASREKVVQWLSRFSLPAIGGGWMAAGPSEMLWEVMETLRVC